MGERGRCLEPKPRLGSIPTPTPIKSPNSREQIAGVFHMANLNGERSSDHGGSRSGRDRRRKSSGDERTERRSGSDRREKADRRKASGKRRKVANGDPPERRDEFRIKK